MEVVRKKILIVGFGKSGISIARYYSKQGVEITIGDIKKEEDIDKSLLEEARRMNIHLELGEHRTETFIGSDEIVVSPGVPLELEPLKIARDRGVPVIGEMELATRVIDTPMIAVTGTNGKTTVVSLISKMLKNSGLKVFTGGNIGTPLIDYAAGRRDADYVVVEVSSFQLDSMRAFSPYISILLNISPDHLDRYPDYEAYVRSKLTIFREQKKGQYAILNDSDERLSQIDPKGTVTFLRYGLEKKEGRNAYLIGKKLIVTIPGKEEYEFNTGNFKLAGIHNLENIMGTILAGMVMDILPETIKKSIEDFEGLPHRMEVIGKIQDVIFINDSKATNVDAAKRAIESLDRNVILIGGGRDKGGDYAPLVNISRGRVKKAIFLGEARALMANAFKGNIPFSLAESMEDAVNQAFTSAGKGDVVLLAPACSSFDMFNDYLERGTVFREAVEKLKNAG
ncbi:MAG: UDP-N-acetylmuramoyl-L-alanine--D-glutamate ligase [Deltaproteobacteria bacterium]|nr:UDP-N-acetylmuramoyl-L-alanine--D-glutamate ligase [Deltaproteobacteria bacterium]